MQAGAHILNRYCRYRRLVVNQAFCVGHGAWSPTGIAITSERHAFYVAEAGHMLQDVTEPGHQLGNALHVAEPGRQKSKHLGGGGHIRKEKIRGNSSPGGGRWPA
jgi:hypothetical protein